MKVFAIKVKHVYTSSKPSVYAIAAEDFYDAKKKLRNILSENSDIAGYFEVEAWVDKDEYLNIENMFKSMRQHVTEKQLNEYVVKDIIE